MGMTAAARAPLPEGRLAELDAFLLALNRAAAEAILPLFRGDHGLVNKLEHGFDPVTEADKGAERAIRALIAERYPDHGVIGEEYGEDRPDAEFVWVLDPVDGTSRFGIIVSGNSATGLVLTWPSRPGITFEVRSGDDLEGFPALEATVPAAAAPAATTSWSTGPLPPGRRFYRVGFNP